MKLLGVVVNLVGSLMITNELRSYSNRLDEGLEIKKNRKRELEFECTNKIGGVGVWLVQDVFMPVMDGLEATRLIRSFEETGSWEAAVNAGIIQPTTPSWTPSSRNRMPIIAVTTSSLSSLILFIYYFIIITLSIAFVIPD